MLSANFGAMDIHVQIRREPLPWTRLYSRDIWMYMGNEDERILRHAYLNSYFQTGLKNSWTYGNRNMEIEKGLDYLKMPTLKLMKFPLISKGVGCRLY